MALLTSTLVTQPRYQRFCSCSSWPSRSVNFSSRGGGCTMKSEEAIETTRDATAADLRQNAPSDIKSKASGTARCTVNVGSIVSHTLLVIIALLVLFPFFWMLDTALKPNSQVFEFPPSFIPSTIQWGNFVEAWPYLPFGHFIFNTLVLAIGRTFLVVLTSSLAASPFPLPPLPVRAP